MKQRYYHTSYRAKCESVCDLATLTAGFLVWRRMSVVTRKADSNQYGPSGPFVAKSRHQDALPYLHISVGDKTAGTLTFSFFDRVAQIA
jgi:hypothetical protein